MPDAIDATTNDATANDATANDAIANDAIPTGSARRAAGPQVEAAVAKSIPALLQRRSSGPRASATAHRVKRLGLWQAITWADYGRQVRALAAKLAQLGVMPGQKVALLSENRPEWLVADLAVQTAGAVTVGVYATSSAEQLHYLLEHSEAVGLIAENGEQVEKWLEIRERLPRLSWLMVMEPEDVAGDFGGSFATGLTWAQALDEGRRLDEADGKLVDARLAAIQADDTALLIYTSGTTSLPKGVMLSHANLLWACEALVAANPIFERDEFLSFLPLSHIVERLISVVAPLRFGYTVSFTENLETILENLREIRPTVFFAVPRIWEKLYSLIELHMQDGDAVKRLAYRLSLRAARRQGGVQAGLARLAVLRLLKDRLGLDRVRLAISGAAPISPEVLAYFRAVGIDIREGYGMTENCGLTSIHQRRVKLGTVGEPFPGVEVRLAEDGEILVRSPGVFAGYYKNPEASAEALQGGWLHSGDIGSFDEDGQLLITDRKKDLIITAGGKNIAPQMLENKLKSSLYIGDAVVVGDGRKYLVALLVLDEDSVSKWAQNQKIPFTTYRDLAANPEIYGLLEGEVNRVNRAVASAETIKRFAVLPKRLYHEDGEVTATLKVRRASIVEKYGDLIASLYR
ncbi:AMP-dependent synthetase/ligase [soil metagenome]